MISGQELQALGVAAEQSKLREAVTAGDMHADRERVRVTATVNGHLSPADREVLQDSMRKAATAGHNHFLLARFPSAACTDNGRRINSGLQDWSATLQGQPAEVYAFWKQDLQPTGIRMVGEVLDFPGGMPGDVGLTVFWS